MLDPDNDAVLMQFDRLIEELLNGTLNRSKFQRWEIEILVDMVSCELPAAARCATLLREYQIAVQRRIREGERIPMRLSEYLETRGMSVRRAADAGQ